MISAAACTFAMTAPSDTDLTGTCDVPLPSRRTAASLIKSHFAVEAATRLLPARMADVGFFGPTHDARRAAGELPRPAWGPRPASKAVMPGHGNSMLMLQLSHGTM